VAIVVCCKQSERIFSRSVERCPLAAYCIHMKHGHFLCHKQQLSQKLRDSTHEVYICPVRAFKITEVAGNPQPVHFLVL
jgi:hypothetical protein